MRLAVRFAFASLLLILLSACQTMPTSTTGEFVSREVALDGKTYRYQVFVPASRFRTGEA